MTIPTLETDRLRLRPFGEKDVEPMTRIFGGHDVLRYFPPMELPDADRMDRMIANWRMHWQTHGYGLWAVELPTTGALLGRCGLQYLAEMDAVEVDFILGRPFWGKGFATEAGRAALQFGFEQLNLARIVGIVHVDNLASHHVLEKLAMIRETRADFFGMPCYQYALAAP